MSKSAGTTKTPPVVTLEVIEVFAEDGKARASDILQDAGLCQISRVGNGMRGKSQKAGTERTLIEYESAEGGRRGDFRLLLEKQGRRTLIDFGQTFDIEKLKGDTNIYGSGEKGRYEFTCRPVGARQMTPVALHPPAPNPVAPGGQLTTQANTWPAPIDLQAQEPPEPDSVAVTKLTNPTPPPDTKKTPTPEAPRPKAEPRKRQSMKAEKNNTALCTFIVDEICRRKGLQKNEFMNGRNRASTPYRNIAMYLLSLHCYRQSGKAIKKAIGGALLYKCAREVAMLVEKEPSGDTAMLIKEIKREVEKGGFIALGDGKPGEASLPKSDRDKKGESRKKMARLASTATPATHDGNGNLSIVDSFIYFGLALGISVPDLATEAGMSASAVHEAIGKIAVRRLGDPETDRILGGLVQQLRTHATAKK